MNITRRHDTDMTVGSIPKHLISFAVPLLIGNVFQQLYNSVDSIVVGNYVGKEALAAIGCTGSILNTFISFFSGLSAGAGVVISNYYGAKNKEGLQKAVHTTVILTMILSVIITVAGVFFTPAMLRFMKTPADVFDEGTIYLRIYFYGVVGLLFYNTGAGILRAVGDSRRPLYILIFCALVNTVLDIVFVRNFGWGVAGAAWATIVAQALSAIVVMVLICRTDAEYKLSVKKLKLSLPILKSVVSIGFPSAIQMAITSFSNVFVQSYVNNFGSAYMAGWAAYTKIDSFATLPLGSLSLAVTTFEGQNYGAKEVKRVRSAPKYAIGLGFALLAVMVPLMNGLSTQMVSLFSNDDIVIEYGAYFFHVISPFYFFTCVNQVLTGTLRGTGYSIPAMVILLSSYVAFRQIYLFTVSKLGFGINAISLGFPMGWTFCAIALTVFYFTKGRKLMNIQI